MEMLATIESRWKRLKDKNKTIKSMADIHQDLMKEMIMYTPNFTPFPLSEDEIKAKWRNGDYLLDGLEDQVDLSFAVPLFRKLIDWSGLEKAKHSLKKLKKSVTDQEIRLVLAESLRNHDKPLWELSERYNVDIPLIAVLVQYSLLPTLDRYSRAWTRCPDLEEWGKGYCPVCGSHPILSEYRDSENFRFLRCGSCGCDWMFQRVMCANCHSTDHKNLDFLFVEEEKNKYRIDVCDGCKTYIKGVNVLEPQSYPLIYLEEMATLHLDLIAQEQGYQRC
ncbi:formate dehydrogenase accessory protein FdhE [Ferviditalea candida]|uniref:Formate dehydrogenase accessory protein FdhE n=1 Tax=Ferviditalea candida TaxID=3108399 RepID=A0ABU5ZH79_9BACL|nr:formate dehydrogenase accessory protein FdhE [Paenibacillaceae bacterium T2]